MIPDDFSQFKIESYSENWKYSKIFQLNKSTKIVYGERVLVIIVSW